MRALSWSFLFSLVVVLLGAPAARAAAPAAAEAAASGDVAAKKELPTTAKSEEKSEEQKRAEEEAERKRKELLARVIVLKWRGTSTDFTDPTLVRNVRSAIARPEAMFFPEVDLYQNGRKVPDRTVVPANQPAVVPDTNLPSVLGAVAEVAAIPWNGLDPNGWYRKAEDLKAYESLVWFVDRVELREPLFLLYAQIGRAAYNANRSSPPFYEYIGGETVNYYYYLAALLAYQDPGLMSKVTDDEVRGDIGLIVGKLQQGFYPTLKLDFEQGDQFNADEFNKSYEVLINGLPMAPDNNAQIDIFLGRTDVYLKRKDTGHGLSERFDVTKLESKNLFIRDIAQKKMGIEFIDQLFLNPNECIPELDGDILNFLAIYQKLHTKADIFVVVPEGGNPNKVWVWRYDRSSAMLRNINAANDDFPVRFALLFSSGIHWNPGVPSVDSDVSDESSLSPNAIANRNRLDPNLDPAVVPFNFELRGHYNRLMINMGAEFGYNAGNDQEWAEYYQTRGRNDNEDIATVQGVEECQQGPNGEYLCNEPLVDVYNRRQFNRNLYLGAGVVLGRDAGIGFGPRFAARWGWTNIPHGGQATAHFGWAFQPPIGDFGKRFRPMVDLDLRGGVNIPMRRSLQYDAWEETKDLPKSNDDRVSRVSPVIGLNAGIGFTF